MVVWGVAHGVPRLVTGTSVGEGLSVLGVPPGRGRSMRDRVLAALEASGSPLSGPVTIEVSPKVGAGRCDSLDPAVALAALVATGSLATPGDVIVWGSLGRGGEIKPCSLDDGALPGFGAGMIAATITGLDPVPVRQLGTVIEILAGGVGTRV